jgi:colicin import membrane protein
LIARRIPSRAVHENSASLHPNATLTARAELTQTAVTALTQTAGPGQPGALSVDPVVPPGGPGSGGRDGGGPSTPSSGGDNTGLPAGIAALLGIAGVAGAAGAGAALTATSSSKRREEEAAAARAEQEAALAAARDAQALAAAQNQADNLAQVAAGQQVAAIDAAYTSEYYAWKAQREAEMADYKKKLAAWEAERRAAELAALAAAQAEAERQRALAYAEWRQAQENLAATGGDMLSETDAKAAYRKSKAEIAARKLELAIQRAERFETKMQQAEAAGAEFEAESMKRKHAIEEPGRDEAAFIAPLLGYGAGVPISKFGPWEHKPEDATVALMGLNGLTEADGVNYVLQSGERDEGSEIVET